MKKELPSLGPLNKMRMYEKMGQLCADEQFSVAAEQYFLMAVS